MPITICFGPFVETRCYFGGIFISVRVGIQKIIIILEGKQTTKPKLVLIQRLFELVLISGSGETPAFKFFEAIQHLS